MGKSNKEFTITFNESFESCYDCHVFAVQSALPLLSFAAWLSAWSGSQFSALPSISHSYKNAQFGLFFSYLHKEKINFILLENKTTRCEQDDVADSEKKLAFHTLSLFDIDCYLFNDNGYRAFTWEYANADFLFLLYVNKGHDISPFLTKFSAAQTSCQNLQNMTEVIFKRERKKKAQHPADFVMNLFNSMSWEMQKKEIEKRKKLTGYSPDATTDFRIPPYSCRELTMQELQFLEEDTTFTSYI